MYNTKINSKVFLLQVKSTTNCQQHRRWMQTETATKNHKRTYTYNSTNCIDTTWVGQVEKRKEKAKGNLRTQAAVASHKSTPQPLCTRCPPTAAQNATHTHTELNLSGLLVWVQVANIFMQNQQQQNTYTHTLIY